MLVYFAVDRWGSESGADDALIAVPVFVGMMVVIAVVSAVVLLSTAPHRVLADRVAMLESAPAPTAVPAATPPPPPPAPKKPLPAPMKYQVAAIEATIDELAEHGVGTLDADELVKAVNAADREKDQAYEPLDWPNLSLGLGILESQRLLTSSQWEFGVRYFWVVPERDED
ncbi:MAG: hypothetical protein WEC34_08325 [Acidimicrobiia bacterium]